MSNYYIRGYMAGTHTGKVCATCNSFSMDTKTRKCRLCGGSKTINSPEDSQEKYLNRGGVIRKFWSR